MGQYCGSLGRPCHYYIFANAAAGSVEDKQNQLLNYLVGLTTPADLMNEIMGGGLSSPWTLVYPLIFPPAIQTVYSLNSNMKNDSSGQISPTNTSQCYAIPNPYYIQALALQDAMLGAKTTNQSLPCVQFYNVPFSMSNTPPVGIVAFENVPNIPGPDGGGFQACFNQMTTGQGMLETPLPIGGQLVCVGDPARPTLDGFTSYQVSWINGPNFLGYAAGRDNPPPLLMNFLNDPTSPINLNALFPPQVPFGPYDTATLQPCSNINSPTCTYAICQSKNTPTGYLCGLGGKCNPSFITDPLPPFHGPTALQDCINCQANGNCGGNVCCPQSQSGGTCPSTPPPPPPPTSGSFVLMAVIGLVIFIVVIVLLIFLVRMINKHIKA